MGRVFSNQNPKFWPIQTVKKKKYLLLFETSKLWGNLSCLEREQIYSQSKSDDHKALKDSNDTTWWVWNKITKQNVRGCGMHAKLLHLCLTLCNPLDCSLPSSSVHGILQARILEWVVTSSSGGSSQPSMAREIPYCWAIGGTLFDYVIFYCLLPLKKSTWKHRFYYCVLLNTNPHNLVPDTK